MAIEVFVEGLRILHITGVRIHSIKSAIERIIPAGTVVILLGVRIKMLAGIEQVRSYGRLIHIAGTGSQSGSIFLQQHPIRIIGIAVIHTIGGIDQLPGAALPVIEQPLDIRASLCNLRYLLFNILPLFSF